MNFLDPWGTDWVQDAAEFVTGFGDAESLNGAFRVRETTGGNSAIDICSDAYSAVRFSGDWACPTGANFSVPSSCFDRRLPR